MVREMILYSGQKCNVLFNLSSGLGIFLLNLFMLKNKSYVSVNGSAQRGVRRQNKPRMNGSADTILVAEGVSFA